VMIGVMNMTSVVICVLVELLVEHTKEIAPWAQGVIFLQTYTILILWFSQSDSVWGTVAKPQTNLSKMKSKEVNNHPVTIKNWVTISSFEVGDYVYLHSTRLVSEHVPCHIVRKGYQLWCRKGILPKLTPVMS
jgi:hypothetical protein